MGNRFTRVTVVGPDHQLDISLAAGEPLVTQMPAVLDLLAVAPGPVPMPWRLACAANGTLEPNRSLNDAAVVDGAVLHLVTSTEAPASPFVDDLERAFADQLAAGLPAFEGAARRSALGAFLAAPTLAALVLCLHLPVGQGLGIAAAVALCSTVGGSALPGRGGAALAWTLPAAAPVLLLLLITVLHPPTGVRGTVPDNQARLLEQACETVSSWPGATMVLIGVECAAAAVVGLIRRSAGLVAASSTAAVAAGLVVVADRAGLPPDRTAGLILLGAVVLASTAGRLALAGAGLVDLLTADETRVPVGGVEAAAAMGRGMAVTTGLVGAAALVAGSACWTLISAPPSGAPGWIGPTIGMVGALVTAVRSRLFSRSAQAVPLLAVGVVAAVAVAFRLPTWLTDPVASIWTALGLLALVVGVTLAGMRAPTSAVARARGARLLDRVDTLGAVSLLPGLMLLFGVIPAVSRWWA